MTTGLYLVGQEERKQGRQEERKAGRKEFEERKKSKDGSNRRMELKTSIEGRNRTPSSFSIHLFSSLPTCEADSHEGGVDKRRVNEGAFCHRDARRLP
jgi:hypothetical protein